MDLTAFFVGLATLTLIYGLLAVGLNMQFGFAGVINFGYVAFFAVGAFSSAIVTLPPPGSAAYAAASAKYGIGLGQPFLLGLVAAGVAGGLLALFIGAVSVRLATHYLAVATFAMAEVVRAVLTNEDWLTRGEFGIASVPRPGQQWIGPGPGYEEAYLALVLVIVAILFGLVYRLGEQPFGRLLRAVRDDETAARALGKASGRAKLKALVLGGVLGGAAGSLWTHSLGVVHVGQFVPIITFQIWLAMLLGGSGNHWGALVGALLLVAIREGTRFVGDIPGLQELTVHDPGFLPSLRFVLIGLLLIAVVRFFPGGVLPERLRRAPAAAAGGPAGATPIVAQVPVGADARPVILEVSDVSRHFGGLAAVDGASFQVRRGTITGLIGPNGAGKSTMMDMICGVQALSGGAISYEGATISGLPPEAIARRGLLRSFQTPRLFQRMTVWENLLVAGSDRQVETVAAGLFGAAGTRKAERATAKRAEEVLAYLELSDKRDTLAGSLSGGQRKLVSLGRLLMQSPADDAARRAGGRRQSAAGARPLRAHRRSQPTGHDLPHRRTRDGPDHALLRPDRRDAPGAGAGGGDARGDPLRSPRRRGLSGRGDVTGAVLEIAGLEAGYGALQILFGIDLSVGAGEHVLVFGPNGAGKSTFVKSLVGLVRPSAGSIRLRGREVAGRAPEDLVAAGLAYVPQVGNVFASLTVRENLEIGSAVLAAKRRAGRIDAMYDLFPVLRERRSQAAGSLSGGERQMLAVARALIPEPSLVILDEPSAGVAPRLVEDIFRMVAGLRETGTAVLMVEQNARRALAHVDRGIVLESGSVRFADTAEALLASDEIDTLYFGSRRTDG